MGSTEQLGVWSNPTPTCQDDTDNFIAAGKTIWLELGNELFLILYHT